MLPGHIFFVDSRWINFVWLNCWLIQVIKLGLNCIPIVITEINIMKHAIAIDSVQTANYFGHFKLVVSTNQSDCQ